MLDGWKNGRLGSKHVEEQRKSSEELKLLKRGEGLKRGKRREMEGLFWHTNSKFITWFLMSVLLSSHLQPVMADLSRLQVELPYK